MRVKFTGPEGAKFAGKELRAVAMNEAKLRDVAELQVSTGWTIPKLRDLSSTLESVAELTLVFFTLRNAGFFVTWDEAGGLSHEDYTLIPEPDDPKAPGQEPVEGPTSARTDSVPGAGDVEALVEPKLSPRPRSKPRSSPPSASAS